MVWGRHRQGQPQTDAGFRLVVGNIATGIYSKCLWLSITVAPSGRHPHETIQQHQFGH